MDGGVHLKEISTGIFLQRGLLCADSGREDLECISILSALCPGCLLIRNSLPMSHWAADTPGIKLGQGRRNSFVVSALRVGKAVSLVLPISSLSCLSWGWDIDLLAGEPVFPGPEMEDQGIILFLGKHQSEDTEKSRLEKATSQVIASLVLSSPVREEYLKAGGKVRKESLGLNLCAVGTWWSSKLLKVLL